MIFVRRFFSLALVIAAVTAPLSGKSSVVGCGTYRGNWQEHLNLHRRSVQVRSRAKLLSVAPLSTAAATAATDIGNIAVIGDGDGVVSRLNPFDLGGKTIRFLPRNSQASQYRFELAGDAADDSSSDSAQLLSDMGDDDTREVRLPFAFPFFGVIYHALFVNSDGNLTFTAGDNLSAERSMARLIGGPPRIAALFTDLDPSRSRRGVRVIPEPGRFVVIWDEVPLYVEFGTGAVQRFQVTLYPDGRIEFSYPAVSVQEAVTGIAPGNFQGTLSVVSFSEGSSQEYAGGVAERFTQTPGVDIVMAALRFYQTHEDAYDYLAFFNTLGLQANSDAVAYEITVRNQCKGIGDESVDVGSQFGSPRRLQAVLNFGALSQYPRDPYAVVPSRSSAGDTTMSVLAHEAGHLFLAYASVRDPNRPAARPMLGRQMAHWAFTFNSEASVLEGNRIEDRGPNTAPRFLTTGTVEAYAPLDQYLMGFRAPEETLPTFLVENATISASSGPRKGVQFDGRRRDVAVEEIIQAEGRRTPDHTVAQRRFRFGFVLIVPESQIPSADQVAQLDRYRTEFEKYFEKATSGRGRADTALKRELRVSAFPAMGLLAQRKAVVTVETARPVETPLVLMVRTRNGVAAAPSSVTIPAGGNKTSFELSGLVTGVEELTIEPVDSAYETVEARVQVLDAARLQIRIESGNRQKPVSSGFLPEPVRFRVTDANDLPYPGVILRASVSAGGNLESTTAVTDNSGIAAFRWAPGNGPASALTVRLDGMPAGPSAIATVAGPPIVVAASAVVNAASYEPGLSPGSLATVFGLNLSGGFTASATQLPLPLDLAGVQVWLDGVPVPVQYVSDTQINFLVPETQPAGMATVTVVSNGGKAEVRAPIVTVQPGIFFQSSTGLGAIVVSGSRLTTDILPAQPGDFLEIYCTGLGPVIRPRGEPPQTIQPVSVRIGNITVPATFSGYSSDGLGLYQVNVQAPPGVSGLTTLSLLVAGKASNEVKVRFQ